MPRGRPRAPGNRRPLNRAEILAAPDLEGPLLVLPLQHHAGQHVARAELLGLERDHQAAVGERRIALRQAHAVGAEVSRLRHAGHDVAAGAHAEREQFVRAARDQRIVGRAQLLFQPRRRRTARD